MVAHIVFFEPKPGIGDGVKRSFALKLAEAAGRVDAIKRGYVGRSVDVDPGYGRSMGDSTYSYAAVLEFDDKAGLVAYLKHPLHVEIGRLFWEACERTTIMEVECKALDDPGLGDLLV